MKPVSARVEGIDVARALAGIIMIQGHAYDGWASPSAKETVSYALTRVLGSAPLPAFLVLAGAAVALRVAAASTRAEDARLVRRRVILRGLGIVAWGYGVSFAFALIDGFDGLDTLLRADVLHVIGLSIASVGWLGIRAAPRSGEGAPPDPRRLALAAVGVGLATTLACPIVSAAASTTSGPLRYVVGLFSDVPGVTLMPYIPLVAWLCAGIGAAQWMLAARARSGDTSPAGAPRRTIAWMAGLAMLVATAGSTGTDAVLGALGGSLSRAHPAVWLNVVDLSGRGVLVLALGALLANRVSGWLRTALLRLGRSSLVAYVFHIPFCYGAFARPIAGRLDMLEATALMIVLLGASYAVVFTRDAARDRFRASRAPRAR